LFRTALGLSYEAADCGLLSADLAAVFVASKG
jgi:hypothetical protein